MARYVSMHTLGCLTRQSAEELVARLRAAQGVTPQRVLVNLQEGKILVEYEAADRETLERWLAAQRLSCDWLLRMEYDSAQGKLALL